ncbi:hypothetical protein Pcinc_017384 [Petrolisthes cinctipes]|uniref:Uncharacterized protein n=1 Tax=Petrolisthes cinctipes TaxID=88211 RepID=A0AAE1FRN0_PETCI|nr:hypothetical protein Pcinc_017384 [Petrolisthes cinctipes]
MASTHVSSGTDSDSDSSDDEQVKLVDQPSPKKSKSSPKKSKPSYKQKLRLEWLQVKQFKGWLKAPAPGKPNPTCSVCSTRLHCTKIGIERHGKSSWHIKSWKASQSQINVDKCFKKQQLPNNYKMITECRIAAILAENNQPLALCKSLVDLIKTTCPANTSEKGMLLQIEISSTKCTNIIRQGLGFRFSKELIDRLKVTKFSIKPDETTDISSDKQLAVTLTMTNMKV